MDINQDAYKEILPGPLNLMPPPVPWVWLRKYKEDTNYLTRFNKVAKKKKKKIIAI